MVLNLGLAAVDIGVGVGVDHLGADAEGGGVDRLHKDTVTAGNPLF